MGNIEEICDKLETERSVAKGSVEGKTVNKSETQEHVHKKIKQRQGQGKIVIRLPTDLLRFIFGYKWDLFYGVSLLLTFSLVTWFGAGQSDLLLVIVTNLDTCIIMDTVTSLIMRLSNIKYHFESISEDSTDSKLIKGLEWLKCNKGTPLDFVCSFPYIFLVYNNVREHILIYQLICLTRMVRLFSSQRYQMEKGIKIFCSLYPICQQDTVTGIEDR